MASESHFLRSRRSHTCAHKLPLALFAAWVICEFAPSLMPISLNDDLRWNIYFYTEDLASVLLAAACYFSLSYTSTILKGVALSVVVTAAAIMLCNALFELFSISASSANSLLLVTIFITLQIFMTRFLFHLEDGDYCTPEDEMVYIIINKPHSFTGLLGVLWSGIGGGFSVYVNGYCYWFNREKGVLVKTIDPDWYRGKRMINCGPATPGKIADLDAMEGQRWSVFNNCFTVFGSWRRKWS